MLLFKDTIIKPSNKLSHCFLIVNETMKQNKYAIIFKSSKRCHLDRNIFRGCLNNKRFIFPKSICQMTGSLTKLFSTATIYTITNIYFQINICCFFFKSFHTCLYFKFISITYCITVALWASFPPIF